VTPREALARAVHDSTWACPTGQTVPNWCDPRSGELFHVSQAESIITGLRRRRYLLISEADLATAIRSDAELFRDLWPDENGPELAAAAIFAALGAAQEKGEAGS